MSGMELRGRYPCPAAVLGALILALGALPALAGEPAASRVTLRDGQRMEGVLRLVTPGMYLVQTEDRLVQIESSAIADVNGRPGPPEVSDSTERLIRYETFESVTPEGHVESWNQVETRNDGSKVWTYIRWGAREDELELFRTMGAWDKYGTRLEHRIEPRKGTGLYDVIVDLDVPVTPGETVQLSRRLTFRDQAQREGNRFTLVFSGDFPEDRIFHRKLMLPAGAEILSVEPEPQQRLEHEGRPFLVWHRYYPKGVRYPLKVTYRLAR